MPRLLLLLVPWLFTACFDIREEITIAADGSGEIHLEYTIPATVLRTIGGESGLRQKLDALADAPGVRVETLDLIEQDSQVRLDLRIAIESMPDFAEAAEGDALAELRRAGPDLMGHFEVQRQGLDIHFERELDLADSLGLATLGISSRDRRERTVELILNLPTAPTTHNADQVSADGRTLRWRRSLGQALSEPISTHLVMPIPLPPWLLPAALGLAAGLIATAVLILRRRARRRPTRR